MTGVFLLKAIFYEGNKKLIEGSCTPLPPKEGEVQIKVAFSGICGTDLHIYHGHMDKRVTFPQIMGHEMSGVVHNVGEGVTGFHVGDRVTVMPLNPCHACPACEVGHEHICQNLKFLGIDTPGAFQSFWTVPAHTLFHLPKQLSLKHGAIIEPLAVACHDVRISELAKGDYVVVLGGGPIGTLIALVAKQTGANVLVSEINPFRIELLKELGIETINPQEKDIDYYVTNQTKGAGADIVFEVTSSQVGANIMTQIARTKGRIVVVSIFNEAPKVELFHLFFKELKLFGARVYEVEDFNRAIELAASGQLPLEHLITDIYPLGQLEEGFKQLESGGRSMKILVNCL